MPANASKVDESIPQNGFASYPDPFAPRPVTFGASFVRGLLATALFRCWHILLFFGAWSTAVTVINNNGHKFSMQPTLLTVIGTVIGFVISYRTTSSFERYNEGRRFWSQIILNSRTFARLVWFHVPEVMPHNKDLPEPDQKAHVIIEKKSVINLLEAFAVAVKHYLRGEDGIYYTDLYYLVKFLPAYALPAGIPSRDDPAETYTPPHPFLSPPMSISTGPGSSPNAHLHGSIRGLSQRRTESASLPHLPLPVTSPHPTPSSLPERSSFLQPPPSLGSFTGREAKQPTSKIGEKGKGSIAAAEEEFLLPARMPPKYHLFDLFPFTLLVRILTKNGKEVKGKKAARLRAKLRDDIASHNLPLEISLYLSSYIATLQIRKAIDPPTITNLLSTLNLLVDALTGLERILTTPVPFSYSIQLWAVTIIYCLALPLQIWQQLKWLTIPGTVVAAYIFFGFLVAGEEIENPFGYDKNDLNLDHFTHNIIRNELKAITAAPVPNPTRWAFSPENNLVFATKSADEEERITPDEWLSKGLEEIQSALATVAVGRTKYV